MVHPDVNRESGTTGRPVEPDDGRWQTVGERMEHQAVVGFTDRVAPMEGRLAPATQNRLGVCPLQLRIFRHLPLTAFHDPAIGPSSCVPANLRFGTSS